MREYEYCEYVRVKDQCLAEEAQISFRLFPWSKNGFLYASCSMFLSRSV